MSQIIKKNILPRILVDIFILIILFVGPWWLFLPIILLLAFHFNFFVEMVIFALFYDLLYSGGSYFLGVDTFFVFVFVSFVIIEVLKRKIIFY